MSTARRVALVTGATGQDGFFLAERLLADDWIVHAVVRRPDALASLADEADHGRLHVHAFDLLETDRVFDLIASVGPDELYNLAGESSVALSLASPEPTWRTNADAVAAILEAVRVHSPATRVYQSSSSEMFGSVPGEAVVHDEDSVLNPQSPYAAAKAAAHVLCHSYREAFGLRVASGILFNHESHRRSPKFLTRKVVDHVRGLRALSRRELAHARPLTVGNLRAQRDWGFAPDYVDGIQLIIRQIAVRAERMAMPTEPDEGRYYRDYVLGTGRLHAVWELIDRAFALAGFKLVWTLEGEDATAWHATFEETGSPAVVVDASLLRPTDPVAIQASPARARHELGWAPRVGLDVFLEDMLETPEREVAFTASRSR